MSDKNNLLKILDLQKKAHLRDGPLSLEKRKDWIDRLINSIIEYQDKIPEAISKDFSHRSETSSMLSDVASSITSLKIARDNVKKWMKPSKRKVSPRILGLLGAKLRVEYQPLGTIGLISPWNFPVVLTFGPLGSIFAAGNRVMIKPSEFTPRTSELMKRMFARAWEDGKITNDEHQLITEVVDFLGMHPERVRRLSEEARTAIDIPPPEEIYLEMLRQALVDEQIIEEENALLDTFRVAYGIDEKMHESLLEKALLEPMYPEHILTYYSALETAMDDGIITNDEDAMLNTLRKSLDISDGEHANLLAKIRDSIK